MAQKDLNVLPQNINSRIRSQSHISLTLEFLKRPLSFSLQDKQCVEANGEGPVQQREGPVQQEEDPKVKMESWQKECDSLRKVTEGIQAITG